MKSILIVCVFLLGCMDSTPKMLEEMGFEDVEKIGSGGCQEYVVKNQIGNEEVYIRRGDSFYKKVKIIGFHGEE